MPRESDTRPSLARRGCRATACRGLRATACRGLRAGAHHSRRVTARRSRRAVLALLVVFVCAGAGAASACGGTTDDGAAAPAATPKEGGTYEYPLTSDPGPFDVTSWASSDTLAVLHQVYEGLVRWELQPDGSLKTVPCLAERWSPNGAATVWTLRLRRGVRFQAPVSREVTAADVVAALRYVADPAHEAVMAYMYAAIVGTDDEGNRRVMSAAQQAAGDDAQPPPFGVEALDRYTVRFTLKYPLAEFPVTLGSPAFWVWPVGHLRKVGRAAYARHPVGTGPYRLLRRVPGESVDLTRNPGWWDSSGGPYIDTIHYEVFAGATSMMLAFQKGSVDWAWVPTGEAAAAGSLPQVERGEWAAVTTPLLGLRYLCVNMKDPVVGGAHGLALRQALAYGCERGPIVDASSGGVFLPAAGLLPPGVPGSGDVPSPYAYDPDKAKALVGGLGPVTLRLAYLIGQEQEATVACLTASYAKIGIRIEAKGMGFDDLIEHVSSGKSQLHLGAWLADYPSADCFLYPLFESSSSPWALGLSYADPEVDALLAEARAEPSAQARAQDYAEVQRLVLADAPVVPLVAFADARLLNERVAGVRFDSLGWVDLWRAWVK